MFDLEKAIREWKRDFTRHGSMEDGLLNDLEWHLREAYEEGISEGFAAEEAFRRAVAQTGGALHIAPECHKNRELALDRRSPWRPARFMPGLAWNYVKISLRKIRRQKIYSFINITGLALGLVCFMLLTLWIRDEVNWDRFHANSEHLFRVQSGLIQQPGAVGPHLKAKFPEIVNSVRLYYDRARSVGQGETVFDERAFVYADASVFEMFNIPFSAGDPATVFTSPASAVLTETAARKYFGRENPLGRTLLVENQFPLRITGVVKNPPRNSDIRFEVLASFKFLDNFLPNQDAAWGSHNFYTFIQLQPGIDYRTVIPKIAPVRRIMDGEPTAWLLTLKPLVDIHLYEDGAIKYVTIFALVAIFILAIAACNFINLTTARSGQRAKEIAVRKVAGAKRLQLITQFLGETLLLSFSALAAALPLALLLFPSFNGLTEREYDASSLFAPGFLLFLTGTAAVIGLTAGVYPALLLSSFRPAGLLKAGGGLTAKPAGRSGLRKTLVAIQFAISITLLIAMVSIQRQVEFIRSFDLGIRKENVVILPAKAPLQKSKEAFVNELLSRPGVVNATFASSFPSAKQQVSGADWEGKDPGYDPVWQFVETDSRYLDTLGIKLVKGRNFPVTPPRRQVEPYFIVNQQAAAEMKLRNPVGVRLTTFGTTGTVIGVVSNYHFKLLHEPVGPLVMLTGPYNIRYILVRIQPENGRTGEVLARIKSVWDKFAPGMPFDYEFLDANYDLNYQTEQQLGMEFGYFTLLGIVISCLGLCGLVAAITGQKRKEAAIRKVLGASSSSILIHINRELFLPVLLASLAAWPAAWWAMTRWLDGYAYHRGLSIEIFAGATLATLAIALLTVSAQAFHAARANPVESLRSE